MSLKKTLLRASAVFAVVIVALGLFAYQKRPRDPGAGYSVPDLGELVPGETHWGEGQFVEYSVGELPLILSSPHGGTLDPAEVPDRTRGYKVGDSNTQELTRLIAEALFELTGRAPHVVISRLSRAKLDPNRDPDLAAQSPQGHRAWLDYHGFIDAAKQETTSTWGSGLYLDIHGHGRRVPRIELGYLVNSSVLNRSDTWVDRVIGRSHSMRSMARRTGVSASELLRGSSSLGALLEARGYQSLPGPREPGPGSTDYWSGGYSTLRHGSFFGGTVSGIQLEHPRTGVRDSDAERRAYARHLAESFVEFMAVHFGHELERPG